MEGLNRKKSDKAERLKKTTEYSYQMHTFKMHCEDVNRNKPVCGFSVYNCAGFLPREALMRIIPFSQ